MQTILDWLKEESEKIKYGTISIIISKYQGDVVGIERQIIDKQKFDPGKKKKLL